VQLSSVVARRDLQKSVVTEADLTDDWEERYVVGRANTHVSPDDSLTTSIARGVVLAAALLAAAASSVVVCSAASAAACGNETLRSSLGSSLLPECRAYEMVTPSYKAGFPFQLRSFASDGEKIILGSPGAVDNPPASGGGIEGNFYMSTRSADGWRLSSMMAPESEFVEQTLPASAAEANDGMSLWKNRAPGQSARSEELYLRSAGGEYTRVGTLTPTEDTSTTTDFLQLADNPYAATSNYRHVVLGADDPANDYWPFDKTTGGESLYEYSGLNNVRPVLVAAKGPKVKDGEEEELTAVCGSKLGGGAGGSSYNALSSDGEAIFFTLSPCVPEPGTDEVYARLHGAMTSPVPAETVDVSARECGGAECEAESGKNFEGASESGGKVFFTSTQKLTGTASNLTAGGSATREGGRPGCAQQEENLSGCNLYEYDFALEAGRRLTLVAGGVDKVRGVAAIAEDGSRVYYVAEGAIPGSGENEFGHSPVGGEPNLYVYDTDTGVTSFIATLVQQDEQDWRRSFGRPVEVTGEGGRFLLFASAALGVTPDESASKPGIPQPVQLFEYDAVTGELVRVTRGEEGWNENGDGVMTGVNPERLMERTAHLGEVADFKSTTNLLNISGDGKTVVFATAGELSPLASAPSARECPSVYVFHSEGRIVDGVVHLLSDGQDVTIHQGEVCGVEFQAMDESGNNVLLSTTDSLLGSDVDGGDVDIYDARVEGGFPQGPVAGESAGCVSGSCEGSVPAGAGVPGVGPSDAGGNAGVTGVFGVAAGSTQTKKGGGGSSSKVHGRGGAPRACSHRPRWRRGACRASSVRRKYASGARAGRLGRGL
jgi:hypothetical protein